MASPSRVGDSQTRRMTLSATASSIPGTLRQEVLIDGRHRLITDQPEQLGGDGSAPSPHELFPAALAACVTVTLVRYARTKGWELGEVQVAVDYDHHSTPRRFEVAVELGGELTDGQLERLARVARACPLRRSIEAGTEFAETISRRPHGPSRELVETGGAP
jgi:putative redox protein